MMHRLLLALAFALPLQAPAATLTLNVQPVSVCTMAGCPPVPYRPRFVSRTLAQAGIGLTFAPVYATGPLAITRDPYGALDPVSALYGYTNWETARGYRTDTAYMGFAAPLSGPTLGIAFLNPLGATPLPFGITEPQANRRFTSAVFAHEIGHILGADHRIGTTLMSPTIPAALYRDPSYLPAIAPESIAAMRTSPLLRPAVAGAPAPPPASRVLTPAPVPLPPTFVAMLGGLALLLGLRRRRGGAISAA